MKVNVDRKKAESERSNIASMETDDGILQGKTIYRLKEIALIYDMSYP